MWTEEKAAGKPWGGRRCRGKVGEEKTGSGSSLGAARSNKIKMKSKRKRPWRKFPNTSKSYVQEAVLYPLFFKNKFVFLISSIYKLRIRKVRKKCALRIVFPF